MSASLARLFCSLFNAIVILLALAVLGGAGGYYLLTGYGLTAAVLLLAGLAGVVALFGAVALQIENNLLLHRIADALESRALQPAGRVAPDAAMPAPRLGADPAPRLGADPALAADPVAGVAATMAAARMMPARSPAQPAQTRAPAPQPAARGPAPEPMLRPPVAAPLAAPARLVAEPRRAPAPQGRVEPVLRGR